MVNPAILVGKSRRQRVEIIREVRPPDCSTKLAESSYTKYSSGPCKASAPGAHLGQPHHQIERI